MPWEVAACTRTSAGFLTLRNDTIPYAFIRSLLRTASSANAMCSRVDGLGMSTFWLGLEGGRMDPPPADCLPYLGTKRVRPWISLLTPAEEHEYG